MLIIASHSSLNILETVRDRGYVPKDQVVTPIRLEPNILKTVGQQ